jgi:hypothetical protein
VASGEVLDARREGGSVRRSVMKVLELLCIAARGTFCKEGSVKAAAY